ncbi:MAG: peptidase S41 [Flavobacteriales bacterium]|nr:peptidase S41 [Flavobacteriales bacterium]|tara:strand:- start:921 stop:2579 length:1659 start_codon:yes stop_codon:yes gene_type:complete
MKKNKYYIIFAILTLFLISSFGDEENTSDRFEIGKNLDIFTELYKEVNRTYVDGTQPGDLMKTGIDAMLESLDPYTVYYPESDIESYKLMTTGQYGGIGARIRKIDDFVVVGEPYEGFPAHKAGLKAGDVILKVDGNSVKGKSTSDLSKILKGNPGTGLTMLIKRPGSDEEFEVSFKREKVQIKSVPYYGMLNDEVGYIKMTSFTRNVSKEIKDAFFDLKKNQDFQSLIFDLRGNPGGLLHEAIKTVELFVAKGQKILESRAKISEWTDTYKTINPPIDKNIKIVFLVDGGSASASEIVSGVMQDFDRAVVLGRRTYGKGLVQVTRKLKYNTSIKVTKAKYYLPSGRCIQAIDYSKRNSNGKAMKTPDSLLAKFTTKRGREVLDASGITPDIIVEKKRLDKVVLALLSNNLIFNYATQYVLSHDTISSASQFKLTDADYDKFIDYLNQKEYDFETSTDKSIELLKSKAEKESLIDEITSEIEIMKKKLMEKKKEQIHQQKKQIKKLLEVEIATRYYLQKGKVQNNLSDDPDVEEALRILEDNNRYQTILSEQ